MFLIGLPKNVNVYLFYGLFLLDIVDRCVICLTSFYLFQAQGLKTQLYHPCYPPGFNISIKLGKDVFDSPCTKNDRPAQFDPQMSVSVMGTGNYQSCLGNVTKMFSFTNCSYSKCSFNGVFQPSVRGNFMVRGPFIQRQQRAQVEGAKLSQNSY